MANDTHEKRREELARLQKENDLLGKIPNDLALALAQARVLTSTRAETVLKRAAAEDPIEAIVADEVAWLDARTARWDMDREAVSWIQCSVFMAEFSRWIRKRAATEYRGMDVGTAAAVYNPRTEEVEIIFNPRFMASIADDRSSPGQGPEPHGSAVNEHEHFHLMLQHVTSRRREPQALWNIATDLAINSLIARGDTQARLPAMLLLPGLMNKGPTDPKLPKEVVEAREKFNKIIAKLPQEKASEWYYTKIKEESEKEGYDWGKTGMKVPGVPNPDGTDGEWVLWPSDQHGGWDDVPEELRDIVEGKIKHALRKAAEKADGQPNGWGNIPSELREEIRAYAFGSVDWKAVLRNFCGNLRTGERSRSIKRIDRRMPYIMPGLKRGRNPSVLVLVDQSGSVSDEVLSRFFGALDGLSRKMTFDVVPFDHTVAEADKFEWKRGTKPQLKRVRGGGTSFDAAIEYANDPRNRGKWEGVILLTDGECSQPQPCRMRLCYVIAPGHKLYFAPRPEEIVVHMSEKDAVGKSGW